MDNKLVSEMITQVRRRADIENSNVCTDAEIIGYLAGAYKELYRAIVLTYENWFISSQSIPLVAGTDTYTIPATMLKLQGVDLVINANASLTLEPFKFAERNRLTNNLTVTGQPAYRYILQGQNIKFVPRPQAAGSVTIWFTPTPANITLASDTVDVIAGFDEWMVIRAAIKVKDKQEMDLGSLPQELAAAQQDVMSICADRDSGSPSSITDVYENNDGLALWPWRQS